MKYFRLLDNINYPLRWHLGNLTPDNNNWKFTQGKRIDISTLNENLKVDIYLPGNAMDYTVTEGYVIPIVSVDVKNALSSIKDLQFISVSIADEKYFAMVVCSVVDCIDESTSLFEKYTSLDPVRPDKAGSYKSFYKMKIDEDKVKSKDLFRIEGYNIAIIVSESVKKAIEKISPLTAIFKEV